MVKVIGILMVIGAVILLGTGVSAIAGRMDGEAVPHSTIIIRMFAGMALLGLGSFTCVFAFSTGIRRSMFSLFKRLHGNRIDEEIARLAKLRADGYITGEDYETAKKKLLGDL